MTITFINNGDGSYKVEGRGSNKFGKFNLRGTLGEDHMMQIYREYQPKALPSPRKRTASVAGLTTEGGGESTAVVQPTLKKAAIVAPPRDTGMRSITTHSLDLRSIHFLDLRSIPTHLFDPQPSNENESPPWPSLIQAPSHSSLILPKPRPTRLPQPQPQPPTLMLHHHLPQQLLPPPPRNKTMEGLSVPHLMYKNATICWRKCRNFPRWEWMCCFYPPYYNPPQMGQIKHWYHHHHHHPHNTLNTSFQHLHPGCLFHWARGLC